MQATKGRWRWTRKLPKWPFKGSELPTCIDYHIRYIDALVVELKTQ
jgi:hypothetical protein